jgi:hypothetical protein
VLRHDAYTFRIRHLQTDMVACLPRNVVITVRSNVTATPDCLVRPGGRPRGETREIYVTSLRFAG